MMNAGNRRIVGILLLLLYCTGLLFVALYQPITIFHPPSQALRITGANYISSSESNPESIVDENWQYQEFPDLWSQNHPEDKGGWYRAEFTLSESPDAVWGIYLPIVTYNVVVFVNDVWVGQSGSFTNPMSRTGYEPPQLFEFDSSLLHSGTNRVDVRLHAQTFHEGYMGDWYIAPVENLLAAYNLKYLLRISVTKWFTIFLYALSFFMLATWYFRRKETDYAVFSITAFIWATHTLDHVVAEVPTSIRMWDAMTLISTYWAVAANVLTAHRIIGTGSKWVERIVIITLLPTFSIFLLPDVATVTQVAYNFWIPLSTLLGAYIIYYFLYSYWQDQGIDTTMVIVAGMPILIFGIHDILMIQGLQSREVGILLHYGLIPGALLYSWWALRRFVVNLNEAEFFGITLEHRLAEKERELNQQFDHVQRLEKQSLLMQERERIMRDLHDGIGGQLVGLSTLLQQPGEVFLKAQQRVQLAITDMRLIVDSLDPTLDDLGTLLAMMRVRVLEQLESTDIKLDWQVIELPTLNGFSPSRTLNITRIIQEAITNSLKHSDSKDLIVTIQLGDFNGQQSICIQVKDTGSIVPDPKHNGHGLKNMQHRAKQAGVHFSLESNENGTTSTLIIPMNPEHEE